MVSYPQQYNNHLDFVSHIETNGLHVLIVSIRRPKLSLEEVRLLTVASCHKLISIQTVCWTCSLTAAEITQLGSADGGC